MGVIAGNCSTGVYLNRREEREGGARPDMGMHNLLHVFVCVGGGGEEKLGVIDLRIKRGRKESSSSHAAYSLVSISIISRDEVKNHKYQHFDTPHAYCQLLPAVCVALNSESPTFDHFRAHF